MKYECNMCGQEIVVCIRDNCSNLFKDGSIVYCENDGYSHFCSLTCVYEEFDIRKGMSEEKDENNEELL